LLALGKRVLADQHARAGPDDPACLFQELPLQRQPSGLAELDVAAGEVEVPLLQVLAEEHTAMADQQAPGDDLGVGFFLRHAGSPRPRVGGRGVMLYRVAARSAGCTDSRSAQHRNVLSGYE